MYVEHIDIDERKKAVQDHIEHKLKLMGCDQLIINQCKEISDSLIDFNSSGATAYEQAVNFGATFVDADNATACTE